MKPAEYRVPYTLLQDTNYTCSEPDGDGHLPKAGVLHPGRVIWLQHAPEVKDKSIRGFAQGIGVVELDSRLLHRV